MIKFVDAAGWDFGDQTVALVKVSRRGLVGEDRKAFVKRAGDTFLKKIADLKFHPDEEVAHGLALGATESIGPNRRGDGFRKKVCQDRCYTFAKYAHPFRNHKDEDPGASYGRVIASAYNEPMSRVELLVGYSRNKEAADRNKGLVGDRECQRLLNGEDIPWSMGCKLAYDICSWCGNKALGGPQDYCTPSTCEAGGLRDYMGKIRKVGNDLHHLHADNDPNLFFHDISAVWRPADRTAYASRADYLSKQASAPALDDTAQHLKLRSPRWLFAETASEEAKLLVKVAEALAAVEHTRGEEPVDTQWWSQVPQLPDFHESKRAEALMTLAERGIIANLDDYARLHGRSAEADAARGRLPGIYTALTKQGSFESWCEQCPWTSVGAGSSQAARYAEKHAHELGLTPEGYRLRAIRSSISPRTKRASAPQGAIGGENLAFDYARYKVAALVRFAPFTTNLLLTFRSALAQDTV